jgi:arylsulfatase A-like enzyme
MRKDAIGSCGGLSSTPNLDNFSRDSTIFNNCITPSPWTFPAHVSLFSGKYASQHGLHESYETKGTELWHRDLDVGVESISEYLKKIGYNTAGISANPWLYPGTLFSRGYNFFSCVGSEERISASERETVRRASEYGKNSQEIISHLVSRGKFRELYQLYSTYRTIKSKERQTNYPLVKGGDKIARTFKESSFEEPFFLFINFYEMHDPYTSYELSVSNGIGNELPGLSLADLLGMKKIRPDEMDKIRKQYYKESSYVDSFFGELINDLKMKNLYNDCLIIVTSDHGQALKERDYYGHSIYLYNEIVEVPLIVKYPQNRIPTLNEGYQSLVYIPRLIKAVINKDYSTDYLTEPMVFSESFGIPQPSIRKVPKKLRKSFDVSRKAVYKNGYKLTVNWTEMIVEELTFKGKLLDWQDKRPICDSLLNEFSALKPSERKDTQQPVGFSSEEELGIAEKLRNLGYA